MPTLYGKPTSINVRKVLWLADELDLALAHDAMDGPLVARGLGTYRVYTRSLVSPA